MREITNAQITGTMLGLEDHGILTCFIDLKFEGGCQGFGGYALDVPTHKDGKFIGRSGSAYGMEFIRRLLATVGVEKWEDLKGKYVRIDAESSKIHKMGHITENKWFYPEIDLVAFEAKLLER